MKEITLKTGRRRTSLDKRKLRRTIRALLIKQREGTLGEVSEAYRGPIIITNKLPPKKTKKKSL